MHHMWKTRDLTAIESDILHLWFGPPTPVFDVLKYNSDEMANNYSKYPDEMLFGALPVVLHELLSI